MKLGMGIRAAEGKSMKTSWIGVNGQWMESHEKGKLKRFDESNALSILGTVVHDVVHVMHWINGFILT